MLKHRPHSSPTHAAKDSDRMAKSESNAKVPRVCPVCSRGYLTYPSQNNKTCSRSCAAKRRGFPKIHPPIMDRFWAKVRKTDTCWLWTGARTRPGWHGHFHVGDRLTTAHRFIWQQTHGSIPTGLNVCHHCDVPNCVNPAHLYIGTQADNMRDAYARGRVKRPIPPHHKRGAA